MPPIDFSRRTALYRLFDQEGRLLYVGVAFDPEARWKGHAAEKAWWGLVMERRVEWFDTRTDALIAEVAAIKADLPLYNIRDLDEPILRHVSRRPGVQPTRVVRVSEEDWAAFELACSAKGTNRADDIRRHMRTRIKNWQQEQRKIAAEERAAG